MLIKYINCLYDNFVSMGIRIIDKNIKFHILLIYFN